MTIPDSASLHLTTAMTLEAWVDPTTVNAAWRDLIYKGNDNYYLEASSTPGGRPAGGGIIGGSYVRGVWHRQSAGCELDACRADL